MAYNGADIAFMTASSFCRRHRGAVVVRANTRKIVREMLFFSHLAAAGPV
jgi:hypothetical protein